MVKLFRSILRAPIEAGLIAALVAVPVYAITSETLSAASKPIAEVNRALSTDKVWGIVAEYKGERFILDRGLTLGDAFDNLPRNDVKAGLYFSAERID